MAETIAMADNNTRPMSMEEKNRMSFKDNLTFKSEKDTYEIYAGSRIGIGGESQVYLAKRESDGEQVVAKIYDEYHDTVLNNSNRKRVIGFLMENSDYRETSIMPLLDYGMITIESDDGKEYTKPIDIIPYCKNSTLIKCDYQKLKSVIIPEVLHGLHLLHAANLVHRDIKPNNLYEIDGEVVLSDFGTTSEILDSKSAGGTGTQRGTPGYTAPEISDRYFTVASDYYSFGCTIATLYKGEHVYQRLLDSNDIGKLNMAMRRDRLPLGCPEAESDLQMLVDSLVMPDEKMRAGYDDVMLWIKDTRSFVSNWKNKRRQGDEDLPLGLNFEGQVCNTGDELTGAILNKWEDGKRYLYRKHFGGFFQQRNPALADKTIDIVEKEATHNQDLGLAMFLHYLNTTDKSKCPIYWRGNTYGKLSDISTAIINNETDEDSITTMLKDRFLSWKFKNSKESAGEDTISAIKEIEDITEAYPQLGYYIFMYKFAPADDRKNPASDEVFKDLTKNGNNWYKNAEDVFKNDKIFAYFYNFGYRDNILAIKKKTTGRFISDDNISDLMLLYGLFENICEDKTSVRRHYLRYGPQSYLYWFQQNIHLYSFNSTEAKEKIEQRIKAIKLNEKMSIDEMFRGLSSLKEYVKDFMPLFQNNYLLTYMGLRTGKDTSGITTRNTDAFFAGDFFGINVPVGYLRSNHNE